eukprot:4065973-Pyramimonas_sp.AAC.1
MHHITPTSSPTLKRPRIEKPPATGNVYDPVSDVEEAPPPTSEYNCANDAASSGGAPSAAGT